MVANATGQSKKKSKHAAAKVLLEKLLADDGLFCKYRAAVLEDLPLMEPQEPIPAVVYVLIAFSNLFSLCYQSSFATSLGMVTQFLLSKNLIGDFVVFYLFVSFCSSVLCSAMFLYNSHHFIS